GCPPLPRLRALEPSEMLRPRERALDRLRAAADEHAESGDPARRLCDSRAPDPRKLPERALDGRIVGERADAAHAHQSLLLLERQRTARDARERIRGAIDVVIERSVPALRRETGDERPLPRRVLRRRIAAAEQHRIAAEPARIGG